MTDGPEKCFVGCADDTHPLISLRFKGNLAWVCPSDMPTLIHSTDALAVKLSRMGETVSGE